MSNLKTELENLYKNIYITERYLGELSDTFWKNGGICCPCCGVEGYSELELKQERREKRVLEIKAKLSKSLCSKEAAYAAFGHLAKPQ
ncbi:hypothetical protein D3C87_324660 [compost metagenome]